MSSFTTVRGRMGLSAIIALAALSFGMFAPLQNAAADSKVTAKVETKSVAKVEPKIEVKEVKQVEVKQVEKSKLPGAPIIRDVVATGKTTASIAYTKPTKEDSDIEKYEVTSYPDGIKSQHKGEGTPTFNLNGLKPDTDYYFVVCGTNEYGTTCSEKSKTVHTLPLAPAFTLSNESETITYGDSIVGYLVNNSGGAGTYSISPALPAGLSFNSSTGQISGAPTSIQSATSYTVTETNVSGVASATYTLTVVKRKLTVTANNSGKTYGSADLALTYDVSGLVNADVVTGNVARTAGEHVGNYSIELGTFAASANYVIDFTAGTFTIAAKHISVSANNASKTYGASDPELTYTADSLVDGDSFSGSLTRQGGSNVGDYAINQGSLSAGDDYVIDYTAGTFTIAAKHISVTANNVGKTYGDSDPELTYSADSLVDGDLFSGSLTRESGSNVGSYSINQGDLSAGANYVIDFTPGTFTIAAKHIAVSANNAGKTYGAVDPALGYTADSLVDGDSFTGNVARESGSNVGSYSINQGDLSAGANYVIDFTAGTFTIGKATPTLGALTNEKRQLDSKTFTIPAPTSSVPGTFTYTSSNPAVCTIVGNVATLVGTGDCVITATFTPTDSANYKSGEKVEMTLTVEAPAKTRVIINCQSMPSSQTGEKFHVCEPFASLSGSELHIAGTFTFTSSDTSVFTTNGTSSEEWRPRGSLTDLSVRSATLTITFTPTNGATYATATLTYTVSVSRTSTTGSSNWLITIR